MNDCEFVLSATQNSFSNANCDFAFDCCTAGNKQSKMEGNNCKT